MFKTFMFGLFLGLAGTGALVHYAPVVDLHREASMITFEANVGNSEVFRINLPRDRILAGIHGKTATPPAMQWPEDAIFAGSQAELFKLRDRNDVVVGIASRIASPFEDSGAFIQWMLYLPARGTMFVVLQTTPTAPGLRSGELRGGTGDFATLSGSVREQFIDDVADPDSETVARIQLITRLVGPPEEEE